MAALTAFSNNFDLHGSLVTYMNGENAIHCSFGENAHLFGSPGMSWCGSLRASSSFFGLDHASILTDLGEDEYPTEEDLLLGDASEFLQQLNQQLVDTVVQTPQSPQSPPGVAQERYRFDHQELNQLGNQIHYQQQQLLEKQLHLPDSPQTCVSDESELAMQDVVVVTTVAVESECFDDVEVKHEPPPLNNKRLERIEDVDESIEAAEVSVDLIQNRRPFQCGLAGCNKTFKNPQTMKMHHKRHYTDGSAVHGLLLPILTTTTTTTTSSSTVSIKPPGQGKKIPSRCPKCRKTFVGLYELRRHYGRKHSEGEKPFGCRKCSKKFYIEVDVRDHEKLCGEPIECRCGLKFAFKCNLVAHKKAHPSCHRQSFELYQHSFDNSKSTATSSDGESQSSGTRKRHRVDELDNSITSPGYMAAYSDPVLDFDNWLLPEAKAARYHFAGGLEFCAEESVWDSHNMHYPSFLDFPNLPSPCSYSVFEPLVGHSQSLQSRKHEPVAQATGSLDSLHHLHSNFNALHDAMARLN